MKKNASLRSLRRGTRAAALLLLTAPAWAQPVPPDAGRLLQEQARPPAPPRAAQPLNIQAPRAADAVPAGGAQVVLRAIRFEGLTVLPAEVLLARLGPLAPAYDLAGLRGLAARATDALRAAGYPFARAYLPPQDLSGGVLRIAVLEGRYGQVQASDPRAQPWLQGLEPGSPIAQAPLERALLLLQDLPGVAAEAVLGPGRTVGSGDLAVQVTQPRRFAGELGLDNHGDRYSGRHRVFGSLHGFGLARFGDEFAARASVSQEGSWTGLLAYSAPVGTQGWRLGASASRTDYRLGGEFESLDAHGSADTLSLDTEYPLLRTQQASLRLDASVQARRLHDRRDSVDYDARKRSWRLPLALSGDLREDDAVTWGALAWTWGTLQLDDAARAADAATARTQGGFGKLTLYLARQQALGGGWALHGRLSAQWADSNLDSSEKFFLGGDDGVRAFPSGEASGDTGALAQLELRWRSGAFEPFAFYDAGHVRIERDPWDASANSRTLSGPGLGVRWAQDAWHAEAALAWRTGNAASRAEPGAGQPQAWLSAAYRF